MAYLTWQKKTITDFSHANINSLYAEGYLFTREGKGAMYQTRSMRIDLSKFELSSENRRVQRKTENIAMDANGLPTTDYGWVIGKMGKDFYDSKFGKGIFSANKIKELMTDTAKSNFNTVLSYTSAEANADSPPQAIGYCICLKTNELLHYCYPFYNLDLDIPNLGLGMMLKAIVWAKKNGKKYVYLGSFQRPTDTYKLQFEGLEWFDGKLWKNNLEELKKHAK